jgi:CRP/FNR family transcriptional regulator
MVNLPRRSRALPIDCAACRTSIEGVCKDCAPEVRQVLAAYKSSDRVIKTGEALFRPAEPCAGLYHLVDGWMFLYGLAEDGRRQILHFALPGALLGLYPGRVAIYGAEALTDAAVCVVPHENLGPLIEEHPGIGLRLAWAVSRERNLAYDHLSSVGRRSARERVARSLLELFVRYRLIWPASRSEEMHLPLTQEHIGDATGLTGVHVNRILRRLRNERIVEFRDRQLWILNPDKLVDIAGINPQRILSWTGRHPPA